MVMMFSTEDVETIISTEAKGLTCLLGAKVLTFSGLRGG